MLPNQLFIAILRGLEPKNAIDVAQILYDEGFKIVEVPLNSPEPFESIKKIKDHFGDKLIVGAGTVITAEQVQQVANAGGEIILSPNCDSDVIAKTCALGLYSFPGVMTPSEAFAALKAGANVLKLFPCEIVQPHVVKAFRAVLPKDAKMIAVGGINDDNMQEFLDVGVSGFGFGSALFTPNMSLAEIRHAAKSIMKFAS